MTTPITITPKPTTIPITSTSSTPITETTSEFKSSTRKYHKTGKYSKKRATTEETDYSATYNNNNNNNNNTATATASTTAAVTTAAAAAAAAPTTTAPTPTTGNTISNSIQETRSYVPTILPKNATIPSTATTSTTNANLTPIYPLTTQSTTQYYQRNFASSSSSNYLNNSMPHGVKRNYQDHYNQSTTTTATNSLQMTNNSNNSNSNNTSLPITNRITTTSSSTPTTMAQPPSLMYSHHHQPKQFYQQHQSGSAVTNPPSSRDPRSSYQELANSKTAEEVSHHNHLVQRFDSAIKKDQISVFQPDYRTHFRSYQDAVSRLLPYHIFDYPQEDMKANDQINELDATKVAIKHYKRKKAIMDKFDELIKKEAKLPYSIHTNLCEKLIYENEKAKTATLREECFQLAELLKKTPR